MYSVIAITGLGGHAFGSWRSRASATRPIDRPMWLHDFLPEHFPDSRIMTYGYDSSLRNPNGANLTDYRRNFAECLRNARRDCPVCPYQPSYKPRVAVCGQLILTLTLPLKFLESSYNFYWTQLGWNISCAGSINKRN